MNARNDTPLQSLYMHRLKQAAINAGVVLVVVIAALTVAFMLLAILAGVTIAFWLAATSTIIAGIVAANVYLYHEHAEVFGLR